MKQLLKLVRQYNHKKMSLQKNRILRNKLRGKIQ